MIFVQDNSVQSINAALNVIQKNSIPAQTRIGRRFSSSATNKFSISVSGNAISCYIPDFPELVANVTTVKLILPQLDTGSPTLNINGLGAKPIKAVRAGQLVDIVAHTGYWEGAGSTSQRVWDNNTTLELIYDGTNWVVVGNPVLCSYFATDKSYSVYANGYIEQWDRFDAGSDVRDPQISNYKFSIRYSDWTTLVANIMPIRSGAISSSANCPMGAGIKGLHSYGIDYALCYGLSANDKCRYLDITSWGY